MEGILVWNPVRDCMWVERMVQREILSRTGTKQFNFNHSFYRHLVPNGTRTLYFTSIQPGQKGISRQNQPQISLIIPVKYLYNSSFYTCFIIQSRF